MVTTMDTTREYVSILMDGDQVSEEMLDPVCCPTMPLPKRGTSTIC